MRPERIPRCDWVGSDPLYRSYHNREWGVPVHDDWLLFEFLILEGAQAGLSWITILKKRMPTAPPSPASTLKKWPVSMGRTYMYIRHQHRTAGMHPQDPQTLREPGANPGSL